MKKIIILATLICSILTSTMTVGYANNEISVYLNNEKIEFDVEPMIVNDRTMVPMRAIFEALGAKVTWDDKTRTVRAMDENKNKGLSMIVGKPYMQTTGSEQPLIILDAPAVIENGRTLVPVRAVSNFFDCAVLWSNTTRTVNIYSNSTVARGITKDTYRSILKCNDDAIQEWYNGAESIDGVMTNGADKSKILQTAKAAQENLNVILNNFSKAISLCEGYSETQNIKSVITTICKKIEPLKAYNINENNLFEFVAAYTEKGIEIITLYETIYGSMDIISGRIHAAK